MKKAVENYLKRHDTKPYSEIKMIEERVYRAQYNDQIHWADSRLECELWILQQKELTIFSESYGHGYV